jgi:hypothetical protein
MPPKKKTIDKAKQKIVKIKNKKRLKIKHLD